MSPADSAPGSARSADGLNEQIRALWLRASGSLNAEQRAEYERLVVAWAAAVEGEVLEAA
jgi:hypothetical protein